VLGFASQARTRSATQVTMARRPSRIQTLLAELKRRSVFKVATVYAVTAWGASLGAAELLPAFGAPDWAVRVFVLTAVLGLPIAIVLAWAYEITPQGIVRDEVQDDRPVLEHGSIGSRQTTMIYGSQGTVRVAWLDGAGGHERVFATTFRIGRDESCELQLDDPLISRQHAEVSHSEGLWWIKDLDSRNGTLLDDRRVTRVPLPTQCTVKLYETGPLLRLTVKAAATAPTVTAALLRSRPE